MIRFASIAPRAPAPPEESRAAPIAALQDHDGFDQRVGLDEDDLDQTLVFPCYQPIARRNGGAARCAQIAGALFHPVTFTMAILLASLPIIAEVPL
jgi:hypothetical protein